MAIYEQRMHAGRQVRSVTLPPEIQPVFLYPQRQSRRPRQDVDHSACRKRGRERWNVTSSTLIYGKSEAILVDCQFRISQTKKLADQISNAREAGETGPRIADSRRPAEHDSTSERNVVRQRFCALAGRGTATEDLEERSDERRRAADRHHVRYALRAFRKKEDRHGNS